MKSGPYHLRPTKEAGLLLTALALAALALGTLGCGERIRATPTPTAPFEWPQGPSSKALLHVRGMGTIEIALYPQLAPATVDNFLKLAHEGFYDGTTFHRVIPGFMIQGGAPNTRDDRPDNDGGGTRPNRIPDEFNPAPHEPGSVSMANLGRPGSADSQFFIVQGSASHLDGKHTVFGRVTSGMDVVDRITQVDVDVHGRWGPKNRPISKVIIEEVEAEPAN